MFKVDRKAAEITRIETEGEHEVTVHKVEEQLDSRGREIALVTFRTDSGGLLTDRFLNQESVWWRVNALVSATDAPIDDGTEVDFAGKRGSFAEFISAMIGLRLVIVTRFEEYQKDGETKRILKVRGMKKAKTVDAEAF
jgi:hypothetical protein